MMTTRTDCHRPSAIVPADYEEHVDYDMGGDWPSVPINMDCTVPVALYDAQGRSVGYREGTHGTGDRCCVRRAEDVSRAEGRAIIGWRGKCGVCGSCFRYGTMFRHVSGELVHMGHDCADKYQLMYDSSATELEQGRRARATATAVTRSRNEAARAEFLAANEGLEAALAIGDTGQTREHAILSDMHARFVRFCTLSDKQVALALKLADNIRNPPPTAPEDVQVPAPIGKTSFEGLIVSAKLRETMRGEYAWKVVVRVQAEDGVWKCWGTCPADVLRKAVAIVEHEAPRADRADAIARTLRGMRVDLTATLERPRTTNLDSYETDAGRERAQSRGADTSFVFMKRPVGYVVAYNHPVKSAKRLKAEAAFEKLMDEERSAILAREFGARYVIPHREVIISLAVLRGITLSGMVAAAAAGKAPRRHAA